MATADSPSSRPLHGFITALNHRTSSRGARVSWRAVWRENIYISDPTRKFWDSNLGTFVPTPIQISLATCFRRSIARCRGFAWPLCTASDRFKQIMVCTQMNAHYQIKCKQQHLPLTLESIRVSIDHDSLSLFSMFVSTKISLFLFQIWLRQKLPTAATNVSG